MCGAPGKEVIVDIRVWMQQHLVYLDGGMGTMLQAAGMQSGELPERRNLTHPDEIVSIHRAYYDAGAHVVNTNTFGANRVKYGENELAAVIEAAVSHAKRAAKESCAPQPKFVALDVGPLGKLIAPYGELDFEDAVNIFAETIRLGVACGVDLIMIETMSDNMETKAALLAAKETCDLPVFVSHAYGADGKLMTGATPAAVIAMLESLGADAIGVNCSFGPAQMQSVVDQYLAYAEVPILIKPNAGLPHCEQGVTQYDVNPSAFAAYMQRYVAMGGRVVGGCCGTTPAHIAALVTATQGMEIALPTKKHRRVISSHQQAVVFDKDPVIVGTSVDSIANPAVKAALQERDLESVTDEAFEDVSDGAEVLAVRLSDEEMADPSLLADLVREIQTLIRLPLWLQTNDPDALQRAIRAYNGKPLVGLPDETAERLEQILPILRSGGAMLALTAADESLLRMAKAGGVDERNLLVISPNTVTYLDS